MPNDDLEAAARAARCLATAAGGIHALMTTNPSSNAATELSNDLSDIYPEAREAIDRVRAELRLTRDQGVRLGDIAAPTAHEAALEMVHAVNRERCREMVVAVNRERYRVEMIGDQVQMWPLAREVTAEIELELERAK